MILASSLRRASAGPHFSTVPSRLVEALFLPWSVSMTSECHTGGLPGRGQHGRSVGDLWSRSPFLDRFRIADYSLGIRRTLSPTLGVRLPFCRCVQWFIL